MRKKETRGKKKKKKKKGGGEGGVGGDGGSGEDGRAGNRKITGKGSTKGASKVPTSVGPGTFQGSGEEDDPEMLSRGVPFPWGARRVDKKLALHCRQLLEPGDGGRCVLASGPPALALAAGHDSSSPHQP